MPGLVSLFVWQQNKENGALELIHSQNIAVYDAEPGKEWIGFSAFLRNISVHFSATRVWATHPTGGTLSPEPPAITLDSPSLLDSFPQKIIFPTRGSLVLAVLASRERNKNQISSIDDSTEWCALYDTNIGAVCD